MPTEMWDLSVPDAPRQLATGESIIVPRPTGSPLSGQWGTMLTLLDTLDPSRQWLADAGYYVGCYQGADAGVGWLAPVIGVDPQGRPAALILPAPLPAPDPIDQASVEAREAALVLAIENEAVRRFGYVVEPRYRASAEQAGWAALHAEAVTHAQTGQMGPWLVAETEGMSPTERAERIAFIRARGDAYIAYRAGVVRSRTALERAVAAAMEPLTVDFAAALDQWAIDAQAAAAIDPEADPPPQPDVTPYAMLADQALALVEPMVAADASWPVAPA